MKKALLLGVVGWLLAAAPVLAHPPVPANVNFTSERGVPFGLVLDGRPLTRGVARQVHVDRLQPGAHWADFTLPTPYGGALRFRSRVWLQPGLETSFVLVARPGWPLSLQQVNAVPLCGPGYDSSGYYNNGGGRYNTPAPYGPGNSYGSQNGYGTIDPYDDGDDHDDDDDDDYATTPDGGYGTNLNSPNGGYNNAPAPNAGYGTPNAPNGGYGNYSNRSNGNYTSGPPPGSYPGSAGSSYRRLAPPEVDALVKTVQERIGEASKLSAARDGLAERSLRADDLGRLLRSMNSEACRIDLATFAYSHVSDPQNFSRVYPAFATISGPRAVEAAVRSTSQR